MRSKLPHSAVIGLLSLAGIAVAAYGLALLYGRRLDVAVQPTLDDDDFALQPLGVALPPPRG